ncbi:MAG: DUF1592 domain-containing protein [Polyangiaceae bacterium]
MVGGGEGGSGGASSSGQAAQGPTSGAGATMWDCADVTAAWVTPTGLSKAEYANTVRDLFGVEADVTADFPADAVYGGDDGGPFRRGPLVSSPPQAHYLQAAGAVADLALADIATLLGCDPVTAGEDACAQQLIDTLGPRALRRPLEAAESTNLFAAYTAAKNSGTFEQGIRAIVVTLVSSPSFVYRLEPDVSGANPGEVVPVPPYELATRLSYFLWKSLPDAELFAAAGSGEISTLEGLEAQAQRMLADPRTLATMEAFHLDLLNLDRGGYPTEDDKDPAKYPEFSNELMQDMRAEIGRFAQRVLLDEDGTLETLLNSRVGFVNDDLAAIYGLPPVGSTELVEVELPAERVGLLTRAAFLTVNAHATSTSPTQRGLSIRRGLLCSDLPPPPPDIDTTIPAPGPGPMTLRQRLEEATADPSCNACHRWFDPIGFTLEGFDGIGRVQSSDDGLPIDDSGVFLSEDADDQWPVDGPVGLAGLLDGHSITMECVAERWFQYALGVEDPNSLGCVQQGFMNGGFEGRKVRNLLLSIALSSAFRYRPALSP